MLLIKHSPSTFVGVAMRHWAIPPQVDKMSKRLQVYLYTVCFMYN